MSTPYAPTPQANAPAGQPAPHAHFVPQPARAAVAPPQATTLGATNTFALLAIVFAFIAPIAGIIFGHMGLSQIKRHGDAGRGIALTGLIISYAYVVLLALFVIFYVFMIVAMFGAMGAAFSDATDYPFPS